MATKFSQINRQNLKWLGRMALILVMVAAAECLVGFLVRKPLPWAVLVAAALPVLLMMFVTQPLLRAEKTEAEKS